MHLLRKCDSSKSVSSSVKLVMKIIDKQSPY